MWKVCVHIILCGLLVFCTNSQSKSKSGCDNICIPLLDNVLDSVYLSQYKRDNKNVILGVFFYTIDTNKFLIIVPFPCIHYYSKSYLEYKNYLIDYAGVDDSVANMILPLHKFKTVYPIEGYISWDDYQGTHWDVEGKTYLIHGKDSLTLFYPDEEHERILLDMLIKEGLFVPPPPPVDLPLNDM